MSPYSNMGYIIRHLFCSFECNPPVQGSDMVVIYDFNFGNVLAPCQPCNLNLSRFFKYVVGIPLCNDLALVQYDELITELERLVTVVGDHDGKSFKIPQQIKKLDTQLVFQECIHCAKWFVKQYDIWTVRQYSS